MRFGVFIPTNKQQTNNNIMSKELVTKVSIKSNHPDWNPVFNSLQAGVDDDASGSFLVIYGNDSQNDSAKISLDWDEWDTLVEVVAKYRKDWEWE